MVAIEVVNESSVLISGSEIRTAWSPLGAVVSRAELRRLRDSGRGWSDEEIEEIASYAESLLQSQFERSYHIAFVTANGDFDIVEEFVAYSDEYANEYAESEYSGQDWYVLDAETGENING